MTLAARTDSFGAGEAKLLTTVHDRLEFGLDSTVKFGLLFATCAESDALVSFELQFLIVGLSVVGEIEFILASW